MDAVKESSHSSSNWRKNEIIKIAEELKFDISSFEIIDGQMKIQQKKLQLN